MNRYRFDFAELGNGSSTLIQSAPLLGSQATLCFGDFSCDMTLLDIAPTEDNTAQERHANAMPSVVQHRPFISLAKRQAMKDLPLEKGAVRIINLQEAVAMGIQVGHGLMGMHKKGRAYGLVTPTNILMTYENTNGVPRGVYKLAEGRTSNEPARSGAYMSVQQLLGVKNSLQSDVFSLLRVMQDQLLGRDLLARNVTKTEALATYAAMVQYVQEPLNTDEKAYYRLQGITRRRIAVLGIYTKGNECTAVARHHMLMKQAGYNAIINPLLTLLEQGFFSTNPPSLKNIMAELQAIQQHADALLAEDPDAGLYTKALHQVVDNLWPNVRLPFERLPVDYGSTLTGFQLPFAMGCSSSYMPTNTKPLHNTNGSDRSRVMHMDHEACCHRWQQQEDPKSLLQAGALHMEESGLVHIAELHQARRARRMRRSGHRRAHDAPTFDVECAFRPITSSCVLQASCPENTADAVSTSENDNLAKDLTFEPAAATFNKAPDAAQHTAYPFTLTAPPAAAAAATPQVTAQNDCDAAQSVLQYAHDDMAGVQQGPACDALSCSSNIHVAEQQQSSNDSSSDTRSPPVSDVDSCGSPDGCMRESSCDSIVGAGLELSCGGSYSHCTVSDDEAECNKLTLQVLAGSADLRTTTADAATSTDSTLGATRSKQQPAQQHEAAQHHARVQDYVQAKVHECTERGHPQGLPTLNLTNFLDMACQVGSQLARLHAEGRTHGDVCVENIQTMTLKARSFHSLKPARPSENQDARSASNEQAPASTQEKCLDVQQFGFMLLDGVLNAAHLAATPEAEQFFPALFDNRPGVQDAWDASTGCKPPPGLLVALLSALPADERQQHVWRMQQQMSPECWDKVFVPLLDLILLSLLLPGTPNAFSMTDMMRELRRVQQAADGAGNADNVACPVMT